MMRSKIHKLRRFADDTEGATLTELAIVVPLLLLLVFGALVVAVAVAGAVVLRARLWWLDRRRLAGQASGRGGRSTLEGEYIPFPYLSPLTRQ